MTDWLLEHQASLQFYFWLSGLGLVATWESLKPLRTPRTSTAARWFRNLVLVGLDLFFVRLCLPVSGIIVAMWAQREGWGVLNQLTVPLPLACVIAVAVLDLGNYAMHRLFHAVPLLWRCHRIHHSDLDFDCTTAFRHHPIEYTLVVASDLVLIALLGAPPIAVAGVATLTLVAVLFNHANVAMPEPADRVLRRFVITPDMHRIHHSALESEGNRNFGGVFPWWDRIFGTYQSVPHVDSARMALGLAEARSPNDVTLPRLLLLAVPSGATGGEPAGRRVT